MIKNKINIAGQIIGIDHPCFIIAEAGVNHNGNLELARQLIDAAVSAGADAVKFQTFVADRLVTSSAPKAEYQKETTDTFESQWGMIHQLELSKESHQELIRYCQDKKILFMSSPFDELSADLLDELGVPVFKIPSGEITNIPYLRHVARKQKPMIISTGMSYLSEVEAAVLAIEGEQNHEYALLQCTSNYPADPADANLMAMETMSRAFGAPVGYSDHTEGIEVPLAAVAMGACVVEKHITTDRNLPGPDHRASLEPLAFHSMVQSIRLVESALGDGRKIPALSEAAIAAVARKSLFAAQDIPAGSTLTNSLVAIMRPGTGLPPNLLRYVVGRTVRNSIPSGTPITLDNLV